jgi:hypothetical protein
MALELEIVKSPDEPASSSWGTNFVNQWTKPTWLDFIGIAGGGLSGGMAKLGGLDAAYGYDLAVSGPSALPGIMGPDGVAGHGTQGLSEQLGATSTSYLAGWATDAALGWAGETVAGAAVVALAPEIMAVAGLVLVAGFAYTAGKIVTSGIDAFNVKQQEMENAPADGSTSPTIHVIGLKDGSTFSYIDGDGRYTISKNGVSVTYDAISGDVLSVNEPSGQSITVNNQTGIYTTTDQSGASTSTKVMQSDDGSLIFSDPSTGQTIGTLSQTATGGIQIGDALGNQSTIPLASSGELPSSIVIDASGTAITTNYKISDTTVTSISTKPDGTVVLTAVTTSNSDGSLLTDYSDISGQLLSRVTTDPITGEVTQTIYNNGSDNLISDSKTFSYVNGHYFLQSGTTSSLDSDGNIVDITKDSSGQILSQNSTGLLSGINTNIDYPDAFDTNIKTITITNTTTNVSTTQTFTPTRNADGSVIPGSYQFETRDNNTDRIIATGLQVYNPTDGSSQLTTMSLKNPTDPTDTRTTWEVDNIDSAGQITQQFTPTTDLQSGVASLTAAVAIYEAIKAGKPLGVIGGALNLSVAINTFEHANDIPALNAAANIVNLAQSLQSLEQSLKAGDNIAALAAADSVVAAGASLAAAGLGAAGQGAASSVASTIASDATVVAPYLNIAVALEHHDYLSAIPQIVNSGAKLSQLAR